MSDKRQPLVMFPNGALMRCETVPEGCVLVIEPELFESELPPVIDQTQAVREAENANGQGT
jgi:hypothetical protein